MSDQNFQLAVQLGICILAIGLLLAFLIRLCSKNRKDLADQLDEINRKQDNYGKYKDTALQNANTNLNFNKTLQWNYIYYVVLVFAAIIALEKEFNTLFAAKILLTIAANLVFLVGLYLTIEIQFQIRRERISAIAIQLAMTDKKNLSSKLLKAKDEAICFFYHPFISLTIIVTIISGYALCLYVLSS